MRDRDLKLNMHTGTQEALSNDTKVNDPVTFNVTPMLKIAYSDFVAAKA